MFDSDNFSSGLDFFTDIFGNQHGTGGNNDYFLIVFLAFCYPVFYEQLVCADVIANLLMRNCIAGLDDDITHSLLGLNFLTNKFLFGLRSLEVS